MVHEQVDEKDLQRKIDDLKKKLHRAQRKQTPSSSDISSNDDGDASYKKRSETPPSESYSFWVWAAICDLTIGAVCGKN